MRGQEGPSPAWTPLSQPLSLPWFCQGVFVPSPGRSARANPALLSAGVGRGCPLSLAVGMHMDTEETMPGTMQEEEEEEEEASTLSQCS